MLYIVVYRSSTVWSIEQFFERCATIESYFALGYEIESREQEEIIILSRETRAYIPYTRYDYFCVTLRFVLESSSVSSR